MEHTFTLFLFTALVPTEPFFQTAVASSSSSQMQLGCAPFATHLTKDTPWAAAALNFHQLETSKRKRFRHRRFSHIGRIGAVQRPA